mmetsp:Transcript_63754/g.113843  ORF Transcript_63754/g.113843 Transcript_63754/m.113843 type:complete len:327 (+) Transcript_63754:376-1356(+)
MLSGLESVCIPRCGRPDVGHGTVVARLVHLRVLAGSVHVGHNEGAVVLLVQVLRHGVLRGVPVWQFCCLVCRLVLRKRDQELVEVLGGGFTRSVDRLRRTGPVLYPPLSLLVPEVSNLVVDLPQLIRQLAHVVHVHGDVKLADEGFVKRGALLVHADAPGNIRLKRQHIAPQSLHVGFHINVVGTLHVEGVVPERLAERQVGLFEDLAGLVKRHHHWQLVNRVIDRQVKDCRVLLPHQRALDARLLPVPRDLEHGRVKLSSGDVGVGLHAIVVMVTIIGLGPEHLCAHMLRCSDAVVSHAKILLCKVVPTEMQGVGSPLHLIKLLL